MDIIYYLFFGIIGAIIATSLPGLLNIYAAKVSRTEGKKNALLFATGVSVGVFCLTLIALTFARFLDKNPQIITLLQKVMLGVFISITIYFLFIAKDVRKQPLKEISHTKTNLFFKGVFLSIINLLPIPFWVYVSISFRGFSLFTFNHEHVFTTVIGSSIGTFLVMAFYSWFFRAKEHKHSLNLNMNYFIGIVTAIISIITFLKIIKTM
ncbi:MAG: LysE family transporter [Flavobacteriales bacterium]